MLQQQEEVIEFGKFSDAIVVEEPDLGKVLDDCKKDQEREMKQTLNDIIKLLK